jgi:hypothetical protein
MNSPNQGAFSGRADSFSVTYCASLAACTDAQRWTTTGGLNVSVRFLVY